ncbi:TonB-dependent receptor [Chitinimonas sp. BJYL2]|uniref:TonB-dependent receptor n=1 Tax=Chitinimonas sp. BJYL2 TaxID=2976696 RepID=UPI0022B3C52A|nr:TonB-dependent receptor plug domain-containing protein [Chitinimonas sp. BJYL2]
MAFPLSPLSRAVIIALGALSLTPSAYADTPAADAATEATTAESQTGAQAEVSDLGSVVVTAQRRSQKLQDVPVPITAISGDAVRDKQIVSSADVERLAPNLSGQATGGRSAKPRWFLRGIGTNDPNNNQEGPLGIYVDEVVIGLQTNQNFPVFDLERVEVLRGPQGTLWGKNNTGGAIHYISRKPQFNKEGYFRVGAGNYGTRNLEAAGNSELVSETVAVRGSVSYEKLDGWARNVVNDDYGPKLEDFAARVQLLANLGNGADLLVSLRTRQRDGGNLPGYLVGATSVNNVTTPNADGAIKQGGGSYIPPYGANPSTTSDFWAGEGNNEQQNHGGTIKLNFKLGANTLTAISARDYGDSDAYSSVGVPANTVIDRNSTLTTTSFSQTTHELRLTSPATGRLSWILGAYRFDQRADNYGQTARFAAGTTTEQYTSSSWLQNSQSTAVFGNFRFNIDAKNATTLGLRQTNEKKDITETTLTATDTAANKGIVDFPIANAWWQAGGTTGTGIVAPLTLFKANKANKFTWDLTQEHRVSPTLLAFGRVATGFRSGGFNQSIVNGAIIETQPETLTDYELGIKSSWLDGKVTANAALFYYDIKDLQLNIQQQVPGTTTTSAAGSSDGNIKGFELELDTQITDRLRVSNALGLLRSEYTNFIYKVGPTTLDASGNEFYRTPKVSYRLDVDYRVPLAGGYQLTLGSDWSYRSHIFHNATVQTDPNQETPAYWNGNARVSLQSPNKSWSANLYVTNITDQSQKVLSQIVNQRGVYPTNFAQPRRYGINFTTRW